MVRDYIAFNQGRSTYGTAILYLEAPSLWPDGHNSLITIIRDQIQARIVPNYRAVITPYAVFESIEIASVRAVVPDVGIITALAEDGAAVTIEAAPLTIPAIMEAPA